MNSKPILALTMGDPAGVGPELCLRAMSEPSVLASCVPVLFGDAGVLAAQPRSAPFGGRIVSLSEWKTLNSVEEPLLVDCQAMDAGQLRMGHLSAACGQAAYTYIEHAISAAMAARVAGVVTAPVNKQALRMGGVSYPGHTEIFTALSGARRSCMMLYSEELTVSMVTTHVGYGEVPLKLSEDRVRDVIELTADAMQRMRGQARLGICGLNPHAGEHGLFGQHEEERFVLPAVLECRGRGITIDGPLPPDAAFTPAWRKRFDAIVTLYHDQGHIPFKMLSFETGVNITLGLPIIRTSVDHGTAFDIAGKGVADPQSLHAAIHAAVRLASVGRKGIPPT